MPDFSRQQMARVEELALEHGGVKVHPPDGESLVLVEVRDGYITRRVLLDEDGQQIQRPAETVVFHLPVDVVRRMVGDDVMAVALAEAAEAPYPEHRVGSVLQDDVAARIVELLATSEQVAAPTSPLMRRARGAEPIRPAVNR